MALVLGTMLWAGCSGGEEGVTDLSMTGASSTVIVEPTEGALPTAPAMTAAVSPTTVATPSTTAESLPASPPAPDESDAVVAGYLAAWQAFTDATKRPDDPALRAMVKSTHTETALATATEILDTFVAKGWVATENGATPARVVVDRNSLHVDGDAAEITVCEVDSGVVIEPGGAPDGSDALVNDLIRTIRLRVRLVKEGEIWRLAGGSTLDERMGEDTCGA